MNLTACLVAFAKSVRAEMRLQDELAKRYPFGMDDPEEICRTAAFYRQTHQPKSYRKVPQLDSYSFADMPKEGVKLYYAAYGCFGTDFKDKITSVNIVCEHGCDNVVAHNASEAKDMFLKAEKARTMGTDTTYYDDWLLTDFGCKA